MAPVSATLALCFGLAQSVQLSRQNPEGYFWSGKNGNLYRTGSAEYGAAFDALKAGPAWSWHSKSNDIVRSAPLIDDKKNIYLSTIPGAVHKFSPDGTELWSYQGAASIPEVPCLYNGAMFATDTAGMVTKLDMETGKAVWSKSAKVANAIGSFGDTWSMTAADGTVVTAVTTTGLNNDIMVGLDADTGDVKWHFKPDHSLFNVLQGIKDGSVVFSDESGEVYRLDLQTGELRWKAGPGAPGEHVQDGFSTGGTVIGPNGILYTTSNAIVGGRKSGYVTAFSFEDGSMLWRTPTEYEANNGAAVGMINGKLTIAIGVGENPDLPNPIKQLLLSVRDGDQELKEKKARILALDAATGKQLWRHELPAWHGWAAGDNIGHICLPDSFGNAAMSGDGTVYVGFESGAFYGVNDKNADGTIDESEVEEYDTHNSFQGSPALAPGMVVATPCNGLYVFKTSA